MDGHWTLNSLAAPALRVWGEEAVLHHLTSNDTHRLSGPAAEVLLFLGSAGPSPIAVLCEALELEDQELLPMLQELAGLGLLLQR